MASIPPTQGGVSVVRAGGGTAVACKALIAWMRAIRSAVERLDAPALGVGGGGGVLGRPGVLGGGGIGADIV